MFRRIYLLIFILLVLTTDSCSKEADVSSYVAARALSSPEVEQEVMSLVNAHRVALGFAPLQYSAVAYEYASSHTDYMIARGSLNHDNFEDRASSISEKTGADFVAENIARDYPTAREAFDGWMNSGSHRATLEGDFTHSAVSVKKDADGQLYYTQLFFRKAP